MPTFETVCRLEGLRSGHEFCSWDPPEPAGPAGASVSLRPPVTGRKPEARLPAPRGVFTVSRLVRGLQNPT